MNKSNHNHPFHLVTPSPWPLLSSLSLLMMLTGVIKWFYYDSSIFLFMWSMLNLNLCNYQWWRDITRESTYQGCHTSWIVNLIKYGMILFITSEVFFFVSFFWSFFHMSLSPSIELGGTWPPMLITPFNPFNIPLLNTITLLSSGISITWAHYSILTQNFSESLNALSITILLGMYFSFLQSLEYLEAMFTITDSVYGASFFLLTGFHGTHVIIGTLFILISMMRLMKNQFSPHHHLGFELSAWYWHFVDVVWLFVYTFLYWWGS